MSHAVLAGNHGYGVAQHVSGPEGHLHVCGGLEAHLTMFHTQMMLKGGSDAVYCKLLMSTLASAALEWFVSLPDGHITTFDQFATLFREQYLVNKAPTPLSYDVFDIKQYQGESMQDYLNRFGV